MTISSSTNRYSYAGNAVTTAFAYSSRFLANGDLVVLLVVDATGVSTTQTINTHYTVTGAGDAAGGTVTAITAPAIGETWIIYGDPTITQPTDLVENDPLPAETLETAFDRLTLICARLRDRVSRAFGLAESDTTTSVVMPTPEANTGLGWNSTGTAIINYVFQTSTTLISLIASGGAALIGYIQAGTGAVATTIQAALRRTVDVDDFGGIADGKWITDLTISLASPTTATSALLPFTSADTGKKILIWGAGTGLESLNTTITYVSAGQVTLATAASTAVTGVNAAVGTDNHAAFLAAVVYLNSLGTGGTLVAKGMRLIQYGNPGNHSLTHDISFPNCSNITFDFRGLFLMGSLNLNEYGVGTATAKNSNVTVLGGTYCGVGDRQEAIIATSWNMMVVLYGENIKIIGPTIMVPAGARAASFQAKSTIGPALDTTKIKNLIFDDYIIQGPSNSLGEPVATSYLSDGIDLATDDGDSLWKNITIGDGMIVNTARGIFTSNTFPDTNKNLAIGNMLIVNPRTTGAWIDNVYGMTIGSITIAALGKSASAQAYNGVGIRMMDCDASCGALSIVGSNVAGLVSALQIDGQNPKSMVLGQVYIDTDNIANKWTTGYEPLIGDVEIANLVIGNATTSVLNSNKRMLIHNLTTRDCTANFTTTLTLPNERISKAQSIALATNGAPITIETMPGFFASNSVSDANATGDATVYTVICNSESYDNTANYDNATGIFTAPIKGQYDFWGAVYLDEIGAGHVSASLRFTGTGIIDTIAYLGNPAAIAVSGQVVVSGGVKSLDMDAGDIIKMTVTVSGSTKTVDVLDTATFFAGKLNR